MIMKLLSYAVAASSLINTSAAARLFAASYSGNVTTLDIVNGAKGISLAVLNTTNQCAPSPVWLELDSKTSTLYCTDEGTWDKANATISSFRVEKDGYLTLNSLIPTPAGGVSSTIYANGSALALAHYGHSLTSISLAQPYNLSIIESINMTNTVKPLLHQVLLDPFEKHIFVPALETDQVHWFSIDPLTFKLNHTGHVTLPAGSGPRHGVFYLPLGGDGSVAYLYVVTEKTNMVHGYEIQYDADQKISGYTSVYNQTTFGDGNIIPASKKVYASEIQITPDNKNIIISSRNDTLSTLINFQTNATITSDSLITFRIDNNGALLSRISHTPAGGSFPRHFSLNHKGDLVAVALQKDHKVVLLQRDLQTGELGREVLSEIILDGEITCVIWDESAEYPPGHGHDGSAAGTGSGGIMPVQTQNGTWSWSSSKKPTATTSTAVPTTMKVISVTATRTATATAIVIETGQTTLLTKTSSVQLFPSLTPGQMADAAGNGKPLPSSPYYPVPASASAAVSSVVAAIVAPPQSSQTQAQPQPTASTTVKAGPVVKNGTEHESVNSEGAVIIGEDWPELKGPY